MIWTFNTTSKEKTSVPPRNHQNNWHFSQRQAVWPRGLHRLSSGYRLSSHCFINKRLWNVGRLFVEVEIVCAISELFIGWKKYTTASSPARKLLLVVFWKSKAILLTQFLDHWARWRGETRGVLVGPNNEPKFLLCRFRTNHTRISPVKYLNIWHTLLSFRLLNIHVSYVSTRVNSTTMKLR